MQKVDKCIEKELLEFVLIINISVFQAMAYNNNSFDGSQRAYPLMN